MSDGTSEALNRSATVSARQLLIRTAELPDSKGELLAILGEYRRALHALIVGSGIANGEMPLAEPDRQG